MPPTQTRTKNVGRALPAMPEMAVFAAQMDLALVDLLEGYFERAAK
jgi:hypothetical protein